MSSKIQNPSESSDSSLAEPANTDGQSTERSSESSLISRLSWWKVFAVVLLGAALASIYALVVIQMNPIQFLQNEVGLLGVFGAGTVVGGCLIGVLTDYYRLSIVNNIQDEKRELYEDIERLSAETTIGEDSRSPQNKLKTLLEAARAGKLRAIDKRSNNLGSRDRIPQSPTEKQTTADVNEIVDRIPSRKLPPDGSVAANVVKELKTFDPESPESLVSEIEELREVSEEYQLMQEVLATATEELVVPEDPTFDDFQSVTQSLTSIHGDIDYSAGSPPNTDLRVFLNNFTEYYRKTVKNFQRYYDQTSTNEVSIDLDAAAQVESTQTGNLPPGSTAKKLIDDLQHSEDDHEMQETLESAIVELNSYQTVIDSLDDEMNMQRDVDELKQSVDELRGPVADDLSSRVDAIDKLLSRTSGMTIVQQLTVQERITVLEDIISTVREIEIYEESDASDRVNQFGTDIDKFIERFTNSSDWSHYNHGIPNLFLDLIEEFHSMAAEAAGHNDDQARAYVDAGERTLDRMEDLYHDPAFNTLLDPGK